MNHRALILFVLALAAGARAAPVKGYADLHLHQMSHLGFGGHWIWGDFDGPPPQALRACSGHGLDHGFLAGNEGGAGNFKSHAKSGFPRFDGWPRWDSISHQQAHAEWLLKAHKEGLQLIVMSAVEQSDFCKIVPSKFRPFPCDDFDSVKRQLAAAHEFARRHADWYAIALSPQEARAAIAAGKLAVVLGAEAGDLFGHADYKQRLAELHALGARSLQVVHETDNRFGGAAWHDPVLLALEAIQYLKHPKEAAKQLKAKLADLVKKHGAHEAVTHDAAEKLAGFNLDPAGRNLKGLTAEGKGLVHELMARHMLVDVSHLSERSIADAFELSKAQAYYPLYVSHAHFRDIEPRAAGEWSYTLAPYRMVAESGGVVGLRTSSTASRGYAGAHVANDCDGSVKSFAQRLAWTTRELHLDVALSTDFGGFASNLSPRFGKDACADATSGQKKGQQGAQKDRHGRAIDERGFAHIGMLSEVIADLKQLGADASPLENSAEAFLNMWERIDSPARARVAKSFDERKALQSIGLR